MSRKSMTLQQALDYSGMSIENLCLAVENGHIILITHDNKPIISKIVTENDFQEGNFLYGASVDFDSLYIYMRTTVSILEVTEDNGNIRTIATQQIHDAPPYVREMPQKKLIEPTPLLDTPHSLEQIHQTTIPRFEEWIVEVTGHDQHKSKDRERLETYYNTKILCKAWADICKSNSTINRHCSIAKKLFLSSDT